MKPATKVRMTEETALAWRPSIVGWSQDILPYYEAIAQELAPDAVIVEVGVHSGRSAIFMAEQLVKLGKTGVTFYAVDSWVGPNFREQLLAAYNLRGTDEARVEGIDLLKVVSVDGVRAARLFDDNSLPFVFIDSDHGLGGMRDHLAAWGPKMKSGGILSGHDYSREDWPGVVEAVDEYFGAANVGRPTRSVWEYRYPEHGAIG